MSARRAPKLGDLGIGRRRYLTRGLLCGLVSHRGQQDLEDPLLEAVVRRSLGIRSELVRSHEHHSGGRLLGDRDRGGSGDLRRAAGLQGEARDRSIKNLGHR
ncbi:hypothetical protein GCM10009672_22620 [Nesterenkonia lutea]